MSIETAPETAAPRRYRAWPAIVLASVIAGVIVAAIWWLAIPSQDFCIAIYPAPAGCAGAARLLPAAVWTGVVVALYAAVVGVALTLGRSKRWPVGLGLVLLVVAAIVGYSATLYS